MFEILFHKSGKDFCSPKRAKTIYGKQFDYFEDLARYVKRCKPKDCWFESEGRTYIANEEGLALARDNNQRLDLFRPDWQEVRTARQLKKNDWGFEYLGTGWYIKNLKIVLVYPNIADEMFRPSAIWPKVWPKDQLFYVIGWEKELLMELFHFCGKLPMRFNSLAPELVQIEKEQKEYEKITGKKIKV